MTDSDLTLNVLVEMRDELRALRRDTDHNFAGLTARADVTNQRLEIIEHTMVDFGTQVVLLGRYMKNSVSRHDNDVERHGDEIADLRTRVEKLEAKD
ncbi:MAG: hypothetical protein ABJE66_13135 [Deltaproteobacteria bacterium]